MLDFPSSGLVAGVTTVTGPSGQEWLWDGVKWTAVGGGGGGGPSGPQQGDVRFDSGKLQQYDGSAWQDIAVGGGWPAMGVTDGSNAAAGQVGEFVTFSSGAIPGDAMGQFVAGSMGTLLPGDWLVYGRFQIPLLPAGVFSLRSAAIMVGGMGTDVVYGTFTPSADGMFGISLSPRRVVAAINRSIGLIVVTDLGAAASSRNMNAWVEAWRMR